MKTIIQIALLSTYLFLIACKKDDGPIAPPSADIHGSVSLYNDGITAVDNAGMTVSIAGSDQLFSTTTNADGEFTLENVTLGTYDLLYEKSGFGTYKKFDIELATADTPVNIPSIPSLGQVSTTEITGLSVDDSGADVKISVTTNPGGTSNSPRYIRYFFNNLSSGASNTAYSTFLDVLQININPEVKTFTVSDLNDLGFSSGTTVFVRVYGDSFYSNDYDEPALDIRIFPNLNTTSADAVSFVVP
jgi:hypothetical protein